MDLLVNSKLSGLCRICLTSRSKETTKKSDDQLSQLYEYCIGIPLIELVNAPTELCDLCIATLETFSQFKDKCIKSENWWKTISLKKLVVKIENEEIVNDCIADETFEALDNDIGNNKIFKEEDETKSISADNESDVCKKENKLEKLHRNATNKKNKKITKKIELICDQCGKLFHNVIPDILGKQGFLQRHMAVCLNGGPIKKDILVQKSENPSEFYCGICAHKSSEASDVRQHFIQHITNNDLECKLCNFVGLDVAHMVTHRYDHISSTTFECPKCPQVLKSKIKIQFHYRSEHLMKPGGFCVLCKKIYNTFKPFKNHTRIHEGRGYTCDLCGLSFSHRYRIIDHLNGHANIRKFVCEKCGARFKRSNALHGHIEAIHMPRKVIKCTHCDQVFKEKNHFKRHLKEKTYVCGVCGKAFAYSAELKSHEIWHSKERKFPCNYCDRKFINKSNLTHHLRIHTGQKPFTCEHCNKSFYQSTALKRHLSVHTGVRAKKCTLCDKTFHTNQRLNQHYSKKHNISESYAMQCSIALPLEDS